MKNYKVEREMIEVTSLHRADTAWIFIDLLGHEHCWYYDGKPAKEYDPDKTYELPTLKWVREPEYYCEDCRDMHSKGHYECLLCGEEVFPKSCADYQRQFIPGLWHYYIDEKEIDKEEFVREILRKQKMNKKF